MAGLLLLAAPPPPPSGRVGLNGFATNPNTDYLFKNFIKGVASMASTNNIHQAVIDDYGIPNQGTLSADYSGQFRLAAGYVGGWRLSFKGKGNFRISGAATVTSDASGVVSGVTTSNLTINGGGSAGTTTIVDFTSAAITTRTFTFLSGGDNTSLKDITLCRTDAPYADDWDDVQSEIPEDQFNQDFIDVMIALNPPHIRDMDLAPANGSNHTRSGYVSQFSSLSYVGFSFQGRLYTTASTADSGATYTAAAATDTPVGAYVDGETAQIKFAVANSGTAPTLEVGASRGFKTIKNLNLGEPGAMTVGQIAANSVWTFYYDSILDCWIGSNGGLSNTVPLSLRVGLSNKINKNYWHNTSFVFDDASNTTDIEYIRDNLNSNLTCYLEPSNEVWNQGFVQTNTAEARGRALGWSLSSGQDYHSYYGLKFCQLCNLADTAWSPRSSSELKKVLGFQMAGPSSSINTYRFLGTNLSAYGFDTAPNRPIDKCTHISPATYYSGSCIRGGAADQPSVTFSAGEITAFQDALDDFDSGNATRIQEALDWIDGDCRAGTKSGVLGGGTIAHQVTNIMPTWNTIAVNNGKKIITYEGGYEGKAPSTTQFTNVFGLATSYSAICQSLIDAYKNDYRFKNTVIFAFNEIASFSEMESQTWYNFSGTERWALLVSVLGGSTWKSYDAMAEYNS